MEREGDDMLFLTEEEQEVLGESARTDTSSIFFKKVRQEAAEAYDQKLRDD